MVKMVMMSDSPTVTTGYGRVMSVLAPAFHELGVDLTVIGWGYRGEPHDYPFTIIPCNAQADRFGEDILGEFIRHERPDILFTLGDPWMTEFVPDLDERTAVMWVSYFPIDGYPIPKQWESWIKNIDVPIVFSRFAQNLVEGVLGRKPPLIYHGVDTGTFQVLDKEECQRNILGFDDKFIVGTVARNQPRKNLPALVRAFAEFAKNKEDVGLYMHTQIRDVGWNVDELVERFGLHEKAYCTDNFVAMKGIPDSELNRLYSMFDLFVLPTMSEGFGLPIIEAQACGTPVLVTDFSACPELVVNRNQLIRVKDTIIMGRNIEQAIVDEADMVRKMNYYYSEWKRNTEMLPKLAAEGRKKAESMAWSIQVKEFARMLEQVAPQAIKRPKNIIPRFYQL